MYFFFRHTFPYIAAVALTAIGLTGCGARAHADTVPQDRMSKVVNHRLKYLLDEIDATDEQREKIHDIKDEVLTELKKNRQKQQKLREQLAEQWLADQPDTDKVHELVGKRVDQARSSARLVTDGILKVHGVLTPKQRRAVAKKVKEHRHRFHGE